MNTQFRRVAIVNRGEPAMRFIHAVREFNQERDAGLRAIALFTDPDRHALFVREADEAVYLGPAQVIDPATNQPRSTYVDYSFVQRALIAARAEAVWAGWGFVAEHAGFADLCRDLGLVFIGPSGDLMRRLGDKINAKIVAAEAGIPVVPWTGRAADTIDEAYRQAEQLGYPLLVKPTAGGGGVGIQRVDSPGQLARAFESARSLAFKHFGNSTVFLERLIDGARHIEVQIIADDYGSIWAAGVRECSIQRRHQKILEEAPSPALTAEEDRFVRDAAVRLVNAAGYRNAGTVEFLFQPERRSFAFMEMNTRLQVEHPVTECTTGLDIVKLQILVARGEGLTGEPPETAGHAVELRLNAENPDEDFAPAPGTVERFRIATGPGVRVESGVSIADVIPAEFDSMVAKIIGYGRTRDEALARLTRVLRESVVVIQGGTSNRTFLLDLLSRPEVRRGEYDVAWLDRLAASGDYLSRQYAAVALVQAAIQAYLHEAALEQTQFYASAARLRPQVREGIGRSVDARYRGNSYSLKVNRLGPQDFRVLVDNTRIDARIERLSEFEYWLTCFGRRHQLISVPEGLAFRIEVEGVSHRVSRDHGGIVASPAPAVVVSIAVNEGDSVREGDQIALLEAMKMEMPVRAPFCGKVKHILTMPYVQVAKGAPLIQLEPDTEEAAMDARRVSFGEASRAGERISCVQSLEELKQLMLGFDVDPAQTARLLEHWKEGGEAAPEGDACRKLEDEILNIFIDICALFQPHERARQAVSGEEPSPEASLFNYSRMLDTRGKGLPESFLSALRRALAHYGVNSLERSPELEESLLSIYKSHQRLDVQAAPILAILQKRLEEIEMEPKGPDEAFRTLLNRMVSLTRDRFPAVSDLARDVRYRCFDQPLFESARRLVYAQAEHHLAYLEANPDASDRGERIHELVDCPQALFGVFARRFPTATARLRELMLEVLTTRYYRIRHLTPCRAVQAGGYLSITAEYVHEGKHIHVFAAHTAYAQTSAALRAMSALFSQIPAGQDIVVDLLVSHPGELGDEEKLQAEVQSLVATANLPRPIRRIVVALAGASEKGGMQFFTYRPGENGYHEDRFYRGIHPMLGKRLHLWRLENFHLHRLPSVDDVLLLHAIAKDNPKDERLFGCVEIRDLTPVRNQKGRIVQLPHLERMLTEVLAGFRRFQAQRPENKRLHWNRVLMFVWPPVNIRPDEWKDIVDKLAPETEGLGLEQVAIRARVIHPQTGELRDTIIRLSSPGGSNVVITFRPASNLQTLKPLSDYTMKVVRMRQRGLMYPYETIKMLTPSRDDASSGYPPGEFVEYDLDEENRLVPVHRAYGENRANIVVGIIRNFTAKYPEGMSRVALFGDPSKDLGALAEPECRRIIAALELAANGQLPLEWYALSAGAKISMDSGVENMDWIALVLRRIIEFTQAGGEINVLVDGINVGAQPYWNAEATMLMHTRGILIMTPKAAMVLTGKRALEYSGSVSAEDNQGIGGYDRIMGVNGQAQYWARNIDEACQILLRHYDHTYIVPGEHFPRRAVTTDPVTRDVQKSSHNGGGEDFVRIGDIFSDATNPGRKKSFDIRQVMKATVDQDHPPLERWAGMRDAETAVVWDAHLGGYPMCMIGIESRPLQRRGFVPGDGPDQWTSGTLFPLSSKKIARSINAASNNRPVAVLANLSGFDGSPESLRKLQLEYGAEIGRAVVNFKGPIVFCVISRYHGGAYVVFSRALNENIEAAALEGTYASVIGGAPAAAVVFANEVDARTRKDPRLQELSTAMAKTEGAEKSRLRRKYDELYKTVHSENLGELADQFDKIHSVQRALKVGALDRIIPPDQLRAYLIDAIERGMHRTAPAHNAVAAGAEAGS